MKKIILLFGLFLGIATASAQDSGEVQINGGLGVSGMGSPIIYAGVDFGVGYNISVGAELLFRTKSYDSTNYTNFGFLTRGDYHFAEHIRAIPSNVDFYGGLSLGYYSWSNDDDKKHPYYDSAVAFRIQTGARYFFTNNFAVNAEPFIEFNNSISSGGIKAGVTYRF
jgi:hypothetical protein